MDLAQKVSDDIAKLQDLLETNQEMRGLIECPVCMELPLPPIYLCKKGHIVCNSCQNKTVSCPLCRGGYSSTRSFVAEGIVAKLSLPCKYRDEGCKTVLFGCDLVDHVKKCEYRPVKCMDCVTQVRYFPFGEYFQHLVTKHNINGISGAEGKIVYNMDKKDLNTVPHSTKYCWPPYYMTLDENIFLVRLHGNVSFVCIWVALIGTSNLSREYEVQIEFKLECEKGFNLTWKGDVNHIRDDPITDVISQGRGLILPLDLIQLTSKTMSKYVEWTYHIHILEKCKKVKSEKENDMNSKSNYVITDNKIKTEIGGQIAGNKNRSSDLECNSSQE